MNQFIDVGLYGFCQACPGRVRPTRVEVEVETEAATTLFGKNYFFKFFSRVQKIVDTYPEYSASLYGIARGPEGFEHLGCCSQMAVFSRDNTPKKSIPEVCILVFVGFSYS